MLAEKIVFSLFDTSQGYSVKWARPQFGYVLSFYLFMFTKFLSIIIDSHFTI